MAVSSWQLAERSPCPSFELWNHVGTTAGLQMYFIYLKVSCQHLKTGKFPIKNEFLKKKKKRWIPSFPLKVRSGDSGSVSSLTPLKIS